VGTATRTCPSPWPPALSATACSTDHRARRASAARRDRQHIQDRHRSSFQSTDTDVNAQRRSERTNCARFARGNRVWRPASRASASIRNGCGCRSTSLRRATVRSGPEEQRRRGRRFFSRELVSGHLAGALSCPDARAERWFRVQIRAISNLCPDALLPPQEPPRPPRQSRRRKTTCRRRAEQP